MDSAPSNPSNPSKLIRASVQGIVYLIDSPTGRVYTYNPLHPTYLGTLEKIPEEDKHLISKTNGCLANARVKFRSDVKEVMTHLREAVAAQRREALATHALVTATATATATATTAAGTGVAVA
jgi:hypothetical protein